MVVGELGEAANSKPNYLIAKANGSINDAKRNLHIDGNIIGNTEGRSMFQRLKELEEHSRKTDAKLEEHRRETKTMLSKRDEVLKDYGILLKELARPVRKRPIGLCNRLGPRSNPTSSMEIEAGDWAVHKAECRGDAILSISHELFTGEEYETAYGIKDHTVNQLGNFLDLFLRLYILSLHFGCPCLIPNHYKNQV